MGYTIAYWCVACVAVLQNIKRMKELNRVLWVAAFLLLFPFLCFHFGIFATKNINEKSISFIAISDR